MAPNDTFRPGRKLYGRRKGPKLSAHQEQLLQTLLPKLALTLEAGRDPRTYFSSPVDDVWLEIGFGAGEHVLWQSEHHPRVELIAAEPYVSGVAKLLSKIDSGGGPRSGGGGNIRVYDDDARNILDA